MRGLVYSVVLLTVAAVVSRALAHGEAAWIAAHPDYSYCCNEHDCHAIEPRAVTLEGDVYRFTYDGVTYSAAESEAKNSIDERFFACIWSGKVRCFFRPMAGS
jgi:hypothetical protein